MSRVIDLRDLERDLVRFLVFFLLFCKPASATHGKVRVTDVGGA